MDTPFYSKLTNAALQGQDISPDACRAILTSSEVDLHLLLNAAYLVRKQTWGREVTLHILDNVQNGSCSQDCQYCAQSRTSRTPIAAYAMKSDEEILAEAQEAYAAGAFRHCLVLSGYGQPPQTIEHLCGLVRAIKSRYPMEVCVSPGVITKQQARALKRAGLDRLNHNLNTSERHYPRICSTHTYQDRLNTIKAAREAGLDICSGIIAGMGEEPTDLIDLAKTLRDIGAASIPVNFFIPMEGTGLERNPALTPEVCLRILCLFRLTNPRAEIRIAAGREIYLKDLEVLGLYPANSIFLDGYLNVKGASRADTLRMIRDAGFTIKSEKNIDELLRDVPREARPQRPPTLLKEMDELRPLRADRTKG